jgi:hypothetical protein
MEGVFKTWRAFSNFEREVAQDRRFVRTAEAESFLLAVKGACERRRLPIQKGQGFWRAQVGHDWRHIKEIDDEVPCAFSPKRMFPPCDRALEGRTNPKGIPVLYLSTSKNAAMSEVRPWLGSLVSLGHFETTRELSVIECVRYHKSGMVYHFEEPSPAEIEKAVWTEIDQAFSKPVTRSDDTGEYVATQILAELFRHLGFDGVAYRSAFGTRTINVALFDLTAAKLTSCQLHEVKAANLSFEEVDGPYWVREAKKTKKISKSRKVSPHKPKMND